MGTDYTPGVCICDGIQQVAGAFLNLVVEALQKLDDVL